MDDVHYTEGVCGDGAAILFDSKPLTISEILNRLNTIERLQREVATASEMISSMQAQRNQAAREREFCRIEWKKAERERDEARAERDAFWDALTEVEAVLRNDLYKNRVANALAIIDEARHMDRDALRAALGGEG